MRVIENITSNGKSSFFLIDSINTEDSQHHITTIMAAPVIAEILSPTVEVEIDCFVTSDVKNNDNDCSETLDLIDSAYKNIKYKKIKDILIYKKRCKWIYTK